MEINNANSVDIQISKRQIRYHFHTWAEERQFKFKSWCLHFLIKTSIKFVSSIFFPFPSLTLYFRNINQKTELFLKFLKTKFHIHTLMGPRLFVYISIDSFRICHSESLFQFGRISRRVILENCHHSSRFKKLVIHIEKKYLSKENEKMKKKFLLEFIRKILGQQWLVIDLSIKLFKYCTKFSYKGPKK